MSDKYQIRNIDAEFKSTQEHLDKCRDIIKRIDDGAKECILDILSCKKKSSVVHKELVTIKDVKINDVEILKSKLEQFNEYQASIRGRQLELQTVLESLVAERKLLREKQEQSIDIDKEFAMKVIFFHLYGRITHTSFDANVEDNIYKGYVSNKGQLKTFELNRDESSNFSITNHLWDLIGDC